MRVGMLAYACRPNAGSEPGAGWTLAAAAARRHDVWLFTEHGNADAIRAASSHLPNLHVVPVKPSLPASMAHTPGGRRLHSLLWHVVARRALKSVHGQWSLDLVHHVTYGSDWAPSAASCLRNVPFIWGPVGGYCASTLALRRYFGVRGIAQEILRAVGTGLARAIFGRRLARRAALCIAQNEDVARRLSRWTDYVEVHPNVAVPTVDGVERGTTRRQGVIGYAGHLYRLKGLGLLLEALSHSSLADWTLELAGGGPDEAWLRHRAAELGVLERVVFLGHVPHDQLFDWLASVTVFAFPSFRDSAGWALAEAVMLRVPAVCLDRGGPPTITSQRGVVPLDPLASLPARLASAIANGGALAPPIWSAERFPGVLDRWYATATRNSKGLNDGHT